ncbi:two-partner secretion domain-containing protein [Microseira wollei]|uniref:Filamentous hemagglutinin outer membrane protein n=1 Tax=Microseira wollei NIES-4236 TaxID=2530354 RepID=A0AAV3X7M6_9CYAN|nr:filamentous hemagglutinin N-terminal domain-containing protein [Microseira wollei]GET38378.1 filamentous hemagglutinin outer membrane protein [Microseira wollei NIES-4236]
MQQDDSRSTGFFPDSLWILASITLACLSQTSPVYSQIAPDGTLSTNVTTTNNLNFTINDGNRVGNNLFHSFREFSVPTGGEAFFNNAEEIQNIFSRVTGGTISNIDGLIRAKGNANLFLLNPSGIIFGANARLNIGGSFLATTASSFKFADGVEFSATNPQAAPLLTIDVPIGLQIGTNPGSIVKQGSAIDNQGRLSGLQVSPGRSLVLVGGGLNLDGGRLIAAGGRVELGGLATSGTVGLAVNGNTLNLSFPPDITRANVFLTNDALVNVVGDGGGDIIVNANNFTATNGGMLAAGTRGVGKSGDITVNANEFSLSGRGANSGSGLYNRAVGGSTGNLGDIRINAQKVSIVGTGSVITPDSPIEEILEESLAATGLHNEVAPLALGNGGNIFINADSFHVSSGAIAQSLTASSGNAGDIVISARDINLSGVSSGIQLVTFGRGNAGNVTIRTARLTTRDGAVVGGLTFAEGKAGTVTVNASESVELIGITPAGYPSTLFVGTHPQSSGNAGEITINTRRLTIQNGASADVSTQGTGEAGNLTIDASESVELSGTSTVNIGNESFEAGSDLLALTTGSGKGGDIRIATPRLTVRDGGKISTAAISGSGAAGSIRIRAQDVELSGTIPNSMLPGGLSARVGETATGAGGNISIETGRLIVRDGAEISAATLGRGDAGAIAIRATDIELIGTGQFGLLDRSSITTQSLDQGRGGDIRIETGRLVVANGAEISSGTAFRPIEQPLPDWQPTPGKPIPPQGGGNAGNIFIRASESVELFGISSSTLLNLSTISSQVGVNTTGNGGTISIATRGLTLRDGAEISAATFGFGNAGFVNVEASRVEVIGGVAGLENVGVFLRPNRNSFAPSRLSAEVFATARGNGGTVTVNADRLTVGDRAQLGVSSQGQGNPGNLDVTSRHLRLDNQGTLTAASSTGRGGNINLQGRNIQLRRQSVISAASAPGAIEGNIGINTETLVLLEASQIRTDAIAPNGGSNIRISPLDESEAIFQSPDSIINASGQLTIEGDIQTEQPQIHGVEIVDSSRLIVDRCAPVRQGSSFVVTGRGGIPPSPNEPLSGETVLVYLVTLDAQEQRSRGAGEQGSRGNTEESLVTSDTTNSTQLVEATGWIINEKGQVVLIAEAPTATPYRPELVPVGCPVRQEKTNL